MLKIFLKFGKLSRSFLIFVCPLGEKFPAWASHSWSRPTRSRTVGEYEYCLFVFRTLGSLLLSELLASSRICHGGSPLSASHRKCTLLSEAECQIINNLQTELARAVPGNIGPLSCARSVLPRPRAIIPPYGPRARLVSGYNFSFLLIQAHS